VNVNNNIRPGDVQQVIITFYIGMPVFEPFTTVIFFFQFMALYHGAHGPVYD
jgi:hypothetical protein